jgi:hypothetical protein
MKRQIVLIVSLVCGLIAAILARAYLTVKENEIKAEKARLVKKYGSIDVLAFNHDVPSGSVLSKADFGKLTVPAIGMRGQAVTEENLADVIGRKLVIGRKTKEVLFWSDVEGGDPRAKGLSSDVKRQMRAMSINVNGAASVSGMIKPNDHVDVIGTFNFPDDEGKIKRGDPVTCTILQNVLVLCGFAIAIRCISPDKFPVFCFCTKRQPGFAGDVSGIILIHHVPHRCHNIRVHILHFGIHAVTHCDKTDTLLRENFLDVSTCFNMISAKSAQIFDKNQVHGTAFHVLHHADKIRTIEICPSIPIITIEVVNAETICLTVIGKHLFLCFD